jgi:hypothetical protein
LAAQDLMWDLGPLTRGSIPQCLHPDLSITGNTASDGSTPAGDGRYFAYYAWVLDKTVYPQFGATSPADLSAFNSGNPLVIEDVQRPYAGGWLRHTETITTA